MKKLPFNWQIIFCLILSVAGCSNVYIDDYLDSEQSCPDAEIDYIDSLMINDIHFVNNYPDFPEDEYDIEYEIGNRLGRVTYKLAGNACLDHQMVNGDATYMEIGTDIHEVKGYPKEFLVVAKDKVYVVDRNESATTNEELYPVKGLVKNIHIESTTDGSRIHTFSEESKKQFLEVWMPLALKDLNHLDKEGKMEGSYFFIEIELENGVSFRQVYWMDTNTFDNGTVGNDSIRAIIEKELNSIKTKD